MFSRSSSVDSQQTSKRGWEGGKRLIVSLPPLTNIASLTSHRSRSNTSVGLAMDLPVGSASTAAPQTEIDAVPVSSKGASVPVLPSTALLRDIHTCYRCCWQQEAASTMRCLYAQPLHPFSPRFRCLLTLIAGRTLSSPLFFLSGPTLTHRLILRRRTRPHKALLCRYDSWSTLPVMHSA
jgi:hypothetical protein